MENQDKIQDVLINFEKTPSKDIPPVLEDYLRVVAKTGKTVFPWTQLKLLFVQKLEQVMEQFNKDDPCDETSFANVESTKFNEMRQRIIDALQKFNGAPFTVQRICELVTQPKKHYTQCDKFLRGIEKNVMVVSTVDPSGRKIVSESRALVNGLDLNGLNDDRSNVNDITDGQPFGPGPLGDWTGNNVAKVWLEPTSTDSRNKPSSAGEENRSNSSSAVEGKGNSSSSACEENTNVSSSTGEENTNNSSSIVEGKGNSSSSACEENTENSSSTGEEENKLGRLKELKSVDEIRENTDSVLPKAATVTENNENKLVVKDCVVKGRTPLSALLSATVSSESGNKAGNTQPTNTEHAISGQSQELTADENAQPISQQSEMPLDNKASQTCNLDSQSKVGVDRSTGKEKHSRELTDAVEDGPPEKKLKIDHCDNESVVVDNVEDESRVQEPASDKSQETVVEESQELVPSGNDATTVQCENTDETQDTMTKTSIEEDITDEKPSSECSEAEAGSVLQSKISEPVTHSSQSETATQNTTAESNQSQKSLQNVQSSNIVSIEEPTPETSVLTDTVPDKIDCTISVGNAVIEENVMGEKIESQVAGNSVDDQTEDSNSGTEVMETETALESKDTAIEQNTGTLDESEPMEQE